MKFFEWTKYLKCINRLVMRYKLMFKPENKRPVTDIFRYEKVIVRRNWFFAGQFVRQHINTTIGETVYNWIKNFIIIFQNICILYI